MEKETMTDVKSTMVEFNLPFSLLIPDGVYPLKLGSQSYRVHIRRITRKESIGSLSGGWIIEGTGNIELPYDKWGRFSYSQVCVEMEGLVKNEPGSSSKFFDAPPRQKIKEIALKVINRFIDVYRTFTEEFHVELLSYPDILDYQIYYNINGKLNKVAMCSLSTGMGGICISLGMPKYKTDEILEDIKYTLVNEKTLDLSEIYILNAKDAVLKEDFRRATLEGVIALELVLSEFIRRRGRAKGISNGDIDGFIKDVGLTGNIKISLKLLLSEDESIDEGLISTCRGAITVRNAIVHKGLRECPSGKTEDRILSIEKLISKIKSL